MGPVLTRLTGACGWLTGAAFWLLLLAGHLPAAALLWLAGAALAYPRLFRWYVGDLLRGRRPV
jgi:hypothetical protein